MSFLRACIKSDRPIRAATVRERFSPGSTDRFLTGAARKSLFIHGLGKLSIRGSMVLVAAGVLLSPNEVRPCGGFCCQLVPIDPAGEQIIFRQDGNQVTAVVLIQYEGDAEDFSWVVPVPGIPELSIGSDLIFNPLELATRPQFNLEIIGEPCPRPVDCLICPQPNLGGTGADGEAPDDGVDILQSLSVGPFDVQIVTSDDPDALAQWLEDNDYDLSDRGRDLIVPYVEEDFNFVALRLRQDQGVGDIQPLIMRYESDIPCVPIRLTAVAALPDMGILVWLLGESRAVPLNYLHVTPNYTRLNWYAGPFNAYASYQGLITAAMNEAGGKGFATDYAGRDLDVSSGLPNPETFTNELVRLSMIEDDAQVIAEAAFGFGFPQDKVLEILRRELPLPEGNDEFIYQVPELLRDTFSTEQLSTARANLVVELNESVIEPLEETLAVFEGDLYMTRFYTTLSPEEMTVDPIFSFNPDLEDQGLERKATMEIECTLGGTRWSLTLGPGTGRDGERVIEGSGDPPGFFIPPPVIDQDSLFRSETVTTSGPPTLVTQKQFGTYQVNDGSGGGVLRLCGFGVGQCGAGTAGILLLTMLGLRLMRTRRPTG